ncbi:hypothetical protein EYF80_009131 [Liparis tanakae]|uniref:Uncharacterized protein n=1 Tax=Liparis tanakae TaxID=230148 RepID=A0A4Z2ITV4_9TELE|nr:hypothetical protein EYF80_009131 [Liparis tanakae]
MRTAAALTICWRLSVSAISRRTRTSCGLIWTNRLTYLGLAAAACGSQEIFIAVFTVDGSLFLHEADIRQGYTAVGTVGTHGCPSPSGDVFGHLDQGVLIFRQNRVQATGIMMDRRRVGLHSPDGPIVIRKVVLFTLSSPEERKEEKNTPNERENKDLGKVE